MQNIAKLKAYFQQNPLMGFVAVIAFVTIFLGIGAFIGTRPKDSETTDKTTPTPTEEVSEDSSTDSESGTAEEDTTASEHKAEPTATETEGNITSTPTKAASATSTPAPTSAPSTFSINILGDIFSDDNCNGSQDNGESRLKDVVVNIFKSDGSAYGSKTTDSSGHYSYENKIAKGEQPTLKIEAVAPANFTIRDAYKSATVQLSESSPSFTKGFPIVPNDKVSTCSS